MSINISLPNSTENAEMKPRITVFGVGGAGGNAVNNMISSELEGVDFVVANTDAQALALSGAERKVQLGVTITQGLGAGSRPDVGRAAAEEVIEDIVENLRGSHMAFITAGMGGGTGTGATPVIASVAREQGILTVGVVTKPFAFEGVHRMRLAEQGIEEMERFVDTLIVIPNQNLFRIANEKTTFTDAFTMADDVLYSGVRGVTDLMVMPGLINLDFADIRAIMSEMGKAMMGTGEAEGERRALDAAEAAIANPLLDDISMKGASGVLLNITGGTDMTLFEVDEAANRIRDEVDPEAQIIFGSTFDDTLDGRLRVSIVATGMDAAAAVQPRPTVLSVVTGPEPALGVADAGEAPDETTVVAMSGDVEEPVPTPAPLAAEWAKPAPATPAANAADPFIPPPPMEADADQPVADAFAAASMANGASMPVASAVVADDAVASEAAPSRVSKGPTLFERVTGTGRAARATEVVAEADAETPAADTEAAEEAAGEQPVLGGLDPTDRLAGSPGEEDLLDIPSFLRRQAN